MSGGRKITTWPVWRLDLLRQLAAKGLSARAIARELDLSLDAVKRRALRSGIRFASRTGGGNSTTWDDPARVTRLAEMAAEGWSSTVIAEALGVSRAAVLGRCLRDGIRLKGGRRKTRARTARSEFGPGPGIVPGVAPAKPAQAKPASGARARAVPAADMRAPGNVVALPVTPRPAVMRDPVPVLDVREGQCRFPLWPGKGHVPFDEKFYCGAPVLKEGASWCAACAARVWSGREARDGQSLATSEPGLGRQDTHRADAGRRARA